MLIIDDLAGNIVLNEFGSAEIRINNRLIVPQNQKLEIILPYRRDFKQGEYLFFELNYDIAAQGLILIASNINSETAQECFKFLVFNLNNLPIQNMKSLYFNENRIDLKPKVVLGRVFREKKAS